MVFYVPLLPLYVLNTADTRWFSSTDPLFYYSADFVQLTHTSSAYTHIFHSCSWPLLGTNPWWKIKLSTQKSRKCTRSSQIICRIFSWFFQNTYVWPNHYCISLWRIVKSKTILPENIVQLLQVGTIHENICIRTSVAITYLCWPV